MKMRRGIGRGGNWWWLLVVSILLGINIEPSWSTCSQPNPVAHGEVHIQNYPKTVNQYPNMTIARVTCRPGYNLLSSQLKIRTCINREWTNNPDGQNVCVPHADGHCVRPPLSFGTYMVISSGDSAWTPGSTSTTSTSSLYPKGTKMQPTCDLGFVLNCSHQSHHQCGRIKCDADGSWTPLDGELITSCFVSGGRVLGSVLNDSSNPNGDNHGTKPESPLKNYLVLTLALVCILIIAALIIFALRRPFFCKKRDGEGAEGNPVIVTSSSPALDHSLPVAMNTGIFLPGARYDLQDCNFQDVPIVGTTVFR